MNVNVPLPTQETPARQGLSIVAPDVRQRRGDVPKSSLERLEKLLGSSVGN